MTKIEQLIAAHKAGTIDLERTPYVDIKKIVDCSNNTILTATKRLGLRAKRGTLTRGGNQHRRLYSSHSDRSWWYSRREFLSWMYRWSVIEERRGKTRNQWATFCKQQSPSS